MTKDEALKLALEALEKIDGAMPFPVGRSAITAIKQALAAQPAQEPVKFKCTVVDDRHPQGIPLEQWGDPPAAQRKPLTFAGLSITKIQLPTGMTSRFEGGVLIIEAAHGIKENT